MHNEFMNASFRFYVVWMWWNSCRANTRTACIIILVSVVQMRSEFTHHFHHHFFLSAFLPLLSLEVVVLVSWLWPLIPIYSTTLGSVTASNSSCYSSQRKDIDSLGVHARQVPAPRKNEAAQKRTKGTSKQVQTLKNKFLQGKKLKVVNPSPVTKTKTRV